MQTVLVLTPHQTPVPHIGAEAPLSPEGAFAAAFEVELPDIDGSLGPPVILAIPVSPVIAVAATAAAVEAAEAGIADATDNALRAATTGIGAEATAWTDQTVLNQAVLEQTVPVQAADAAGAKADLSPCPRFAEHKPVGGQGDMALGIRPARAGEATSQNAGPSEAGLANRSTVADAAWTAIRSTGDADGLSVTSPSDAVKKAVLDRAEGPGQVGGGGTKHARSAIPEASDQATGPLRQGANPATTAALAVAPAGGPQMPPGSDLRKDAAPSVAPIAVSGSDAGSPAAPVTQAEGEHGAQDGRRGPAVPLSANAEAGKPALPVYEGQPAEGQTRPGMWESMFSSLAFPLFAAGEVARALRPVLTTGTDALPLPTQVGDPATLATPHQPAAAAPGSQAGLTNTAPPENETPKAAAPAVAPAVALWPQATAWRMAADEPDRATGDEGLQALVAPGTVATAGVASGPSAIPATLSSPVPHLAAQMAAALSQSADGATELALSPDELGRVRLRLEPDATNPDRMVVMITFERPETLDLFRRHAGELAEALRAAGYSGADIGFGQDQSGSEGSDGSPGRSADWGAGQDQPDPTPALSPAPRLAAGASLDLRL